MVMESFRECLGIEPEESEAALRKEDIHRLLISLINDDEEVLLADGFEDAFVGVARQFNKPMAIYDRRLCIEILMNRDGMSEDEAEEFFSFNVEGAWVGDNTPAFLELPLGDEEELDPLALAS